MSSAIFERVQSLIPAEVALDLASFTGLVEAELRRQMKSDEALVEEAGLLTLEAGGKRLRPMMAAVSAWATNPGADRDRLVKLGACLEMIHMATLIHDDVIDGAATRRGKPVAAVVQGGTAAILSGDVLLAKAMTILADDGDLDIIRLVSRAVVEMAEGEVAEVAVRGDFELTEAAHHRILRMKTAAFIEACCRVGAYVSDASASQSEALAQYGHHIGMAFQIADDLLDFRGDQSKTGKPLATDFREGCATLPLILARDRVGAADRDWLARAFGCSVVDVERIRELMEETGAFRDASLAADEHIHLAMKSLHLLEDSAFRFLLEWFSGFIVKREA